LGLEINCIYIKQLERKLVQIILQEVAIRAWNFHEDADLVDVPRIVSVEIWTSCLAGVLCNQSLIPIT